METRELLVYDASVAQTVLFVLAIVSVALPAALWGFVLGLWSKRLKFVLEQIVDFGIRCVIGLQSICVLAYAVPGWSAESSYFLCCAETWIWFDYFDGVVEDSQDVPFTEKLKGDLSGFSFNHWSNTYYGNGFTATAALILAVVLCLLYWFALRYCCKLKCGFLQLEPLVKTLQLVHMRLSLSLLLEIRFLYDGKREEWSSGTGIVFSFLAVVVLPLVLFSVTALKHPASLDEEQIRGLYGSMYREYRGGCRTIYMTLGYVENLVLGIAVCVLGQWRKSQAYLIVAVEAVSWAEVVVLRPYRLPEHNIFESLLRLLRLLLAVLLVLIFEDVDLGDHQSFIVFILVLVWLALQMISGIILTFVSLRHVRSFFSDETFEDFLYEHPQGLALDPSPKPSKAESSPIQPPTSLPKEASEASS
jgi:hypothetical protein